MRPLDRVKRHVQLTRQTYASKDDPGTPPFLILFINSICNQTCEHCFYWRQLNSPDDLTVDELRLLSEDLGHVETLNLSGGEPFLRKEFAEIVRMFVRNNGVRQIYVPTNGSFADRTVNAVRGVLEEPSVDLFAVEFSLDGLAAYHDTFRGMKDAFARAMATYDALAAVQQRDPRLRIHSISTVTGTNLDEIRRLTEYLYDRCPAMDHHNLALIRGDRKNPSLQGPALAEYSRLYEHVRSVWAPREKGRYGSWVEPMLQAAKIQTAQERRQVVPCSAGVMNAVIYANGDVSLCETHAPIGNLRQASFRTLWRSDSARQLRRSIAARECHCTNEIFLWPSIVYRPLRLIRMLGQTQPWSDARTATSQPTSGGGGPLPAGLNG